MHIPTSILRHIVRHTHQSGVSLKAENPVGPYNKVGFGTILEVCTNSGWYFCFMHIYYRCRSIRRRSIYPTAVLLPTAGGIGIVSLLLSVGCVSLHEACCPYCVRVMVRRKSSSRDYNTLPLFVVVAKKTKKTRLCSYPLLCRPVTHVPYSVWMRGDPALLTSCADDARICTLKHFTSTKIYSKLCACQLLLSGRVPQTSAVPVEQRNGPIHHFDVLGSTGSSNFYAMYIRTTWYTLLSRTAAESCFAVLPFYSSVAFRRGLTSSRPLCRCSGPSPSGACGWASRRASCSPTLPVGNSTKAGRVLHPRDIVLVTSRYYLPLRDFACSTYGLPRISV